MSIHQIKRISCKDGLAPSIARFSMRTDIAGMPIAYEALAEFPEAVRLRRFQKLLADGPSLFWQRYSAKLASARAASETDFCCFAVRMASQNASSI
jgi:hypothetical protein